MHRAVFQGFCAALIASTLLAAPAGVAAQADRAPAPANLQPLLASLDGWIGETRISLARLRIDKWKAPSDLKRVAETRAQSIDRNLEQALPAVVETVRATPEGLSASFSLYRNLNALSDVMASLTEAAGAFGDKDEYKVLGENAIRLDSIRRSFAERMDAMMTQKDARISYLEAQAQQTQSVPAETSVKKIVVDDTAPTKVQPKSRKTAPTRPKPK